MGRMKQLGMTLTMVAACLIGGCGKSKEDQLVGTWRDTSEERFDSTLTFNKDGSLNADVRLKMENAPEHVKMNGTWKIADGKLVWTIEKSDYENDKFAGTDTNTLESVDEKSFKLVDTKGKTTVYEKVK